MWVLTWLGWWLSCDVSYERCWFLCIMSPVITRGVMTLQRHFIDGGDEDTDDDILEGRYSEISWLWWLVLAACWTKRGQCLCTHIIVFNTCNFSNLPRFLFLVSTVKNTVWCERKRWLVYWFWPSRKEPIDNIKFKSA